MPLRWTGDPRRPLCVWPAQAELGEGTLWSEREQALYWVDILGRRLHRFRPSDEARASWAFEEEISALAERADAAGLIVTLRRGLKGWYESHKKLARLVYPIWLYVSITGVVVYLLLYQIYPGR